MINDTDIRYAENTGDSIKIHTMINFTNFLLNRYECATYDKDKKLVSLIHEWPDSTINSNLSTTQNNNKVTFKYNAAGDDYECIYTLLGEKKDKAELTQLTTESLSGTRTTYRKDEDFTGTGYGKYIKTIEKNGKVKKKDIVEWYKMIRWNNCPYKVMNHLLKEYMHVSEII